MPAQRTTGNWGMLDMQSGLRWLQREVAAFGGDPDRVTIHGQCTCVRLHPYCTHHGPPSNGPATTRPRPSHSPRTTLAQPCDLWRPHVAASGGDAVELHHVMPGSRGLLSGIISESGGLSARRLQEGLATGAAAAKAAGCSPSGANLTTNLTGNLATANLATADPTKGGVKACMQRVAALAITSQTGALPFSPLVDGAAIPADPVLMLRRGEVNPGVGFLAGAQTNDSNRELLPRYTDKEGELRPLWAPAYRLAVQAEVGKARLEQVLRN